MSESQNMRTYMRLAEGREITRDDIDVEERYKAVLQKYISLHKRYADELKHNPRDGNTHPVYSSLFPGVWGNVAFSTPKFDDGVRYDDVVLWYHQEQGNIDADVDRASKLMPGQTGGQATLANLFMRDVKEAISSGQ